ncbi:MAG: ATP-binding protein [Myxococcota bacterium]
MSDKETPMYTAENITILRGLEPVRKRPAMYIGSVGRDGVRHLLAEAVAFVIEEHRAGHCARLEVWKEDSGHWNVRDDGRGLPSDRLKHAMTELSGRFGLGVPVINGLSEDATLTAERDGERYAIHFRRGEQVAPQESLTPAGETGTHLRFLPDASIFTNLLVNPSDLRTWLFELACFNPGMAVHLQGERLDAPAGMVSLAEACAGGPLKDVVRFEAVQEDMAVFGVLGWRGDGPAKVWSFCNQRETPMGGTHVDGANLALEDLPETGRWLLLNVQIASPYFSGQRRERLKNEEVRSVVESAIRSHRMFS